MGYNDLLADPRCVPSLPSASVAVSLLRTEAVEFPVGMLVLTGNLFEHRSIILACSSLFPHL